MHSACCLQDAFSPHKGHVSSRLGSKRHCRLCMCPLLGARCPASKSAEWNDAPHHMPKQECRQRTVYSVHQSFPNQQSMPEMEPRTKMNQACKQIRNFHGSSFRQKRHSMKWHEMTSNKKTDVSWCFVLFNGWCSVVFSWAFIPAIAFALPLGEEIQVKVSTECAASCLEAHIAPIASFHLHVVWNGKRAWQVDESLG